MTIKLYQKATPAEIRDFTVNTLSGAGVDPIQLNIVERWMDRWIANDSRIESLDQALEDIRDLEDDVETRDHEIARLTVLERHCRTALVKTDKALEKCRAGRKGKKK